MSARQKVFMVLKIDILLKRGRDYNVLYVVSNILVSCQNEFEWGVLYNILWMLFSPYKNRLFLLWRWMFKKKIPPIWPLVILTIDIKFFSRNLSKVWLKTRLNNQSFPSKTWSKFSLTKFFDFLNLHQKRCQRTLMNFDGIETHPIILKTLTDFDGNWPIKISFRNQDLIQPFLFVFEFTAER
jgi:hypothetical protein